MIDLYDMLFEVSNDIRHKILLILRNDTATVTYISQKLEISLTEASRHFNRLSQAGLIQKNPDGYYSITLIGKTMLAQIEPLSFIVEHSEYFRNHDATRIPKQYLNRIHEISEAEPNYTKRANIMRLVEKIERIPLEAEEYSFCILDESSMELVLYSEPEKEKDENTESIIDIISQGIISHALFPSSLDKKKIPSDSLKAFYDLHKFGNFEFRIIDNIDVFVYMNEKFVIISFPDKNGAFDYLGFESTDQRTLNWCKGLFEYYWMRSKPFLTYDSN